MSPRKSSRQAVSDRHRAIVEEVQRCRYVSVVALSEAFGLSQPTIRRDLKRLEQMGLLRRVHGGAEATLQPGQVPRFSVRLMQNAEVKQAIGQAASALIRPGNTILLDSGTTVLEIARNLPDSLLNDGGVTVLTRSLTIAYELRRRRQIRLIILGGLYLHDFDTLVGPQVEQALQEMHVDILFAGTDGLTVESGMSTDNVSEVGLLRTMAGRADRVVVVTDSSKIGVSNLQMILSLNEIHALITDSEAPEAFVEAVRDQGIKVTVVPKP